MSSHGSPRSSQAMFNPEQASFINSIRTHKRFKLRAVSIGSAALGLFLNFTALMVSLKARNAGGPAKIAGLAFVPLLVSVVWNHVDVSSHKLLGRGIPIQGILFMETLNFSLFLAILIANGIVTSNYDGDDWRGIKGLPALMYYDSMPWIVCASISVIMVHKEILRLFSSLFSTAHRGNGCSHCSHCRAEWSMQTVKPQGGAGYSLLAPEEYDENAEVDRGTVSMEEARQGESTPLTAGAGESA